MHFACVSFAYEGSFRLLLDVSSWILHLMGDTQTAFLELLSWTVLSQVYDTLVCKTSYFRDFILKPNTHNQRI